MSTPTPTPDHAPGRVPIRRALVSVYDKAELVEVGRLLLEAGVEIVSTGSTAARLTAAGLPVTPVEAVTGFPERLDGRVKTLHPAIHAGLLADVRRESHAAQLAELGLAPFELLISNLYPFSATVASGAGLEECVEQIDIGGPAMVRAAAKNFACVAVVTGPIQYPGLRSALTAGGFSLAQRRELAATAFAHTASYDVAVATWLAQGLTDPATVFPVWAGATWDRAAVLRYGENPHQQAALYRDRSGLAAGQDLGLAGARQLHGKEMSYNNYVDADAAGRAAGDFAEPAVAIIKHANPCGIAVGADIAEAHRKAHACDPVSAYGGVVAANRTVDEAMARQVSEVFTEVILAPGYDDAALGVLTGRKNLRVLQVASARSRPVELREIDGGIVVQTRDRVDLDHDEATAWRLVAGEPVSAEVLADLQFAWRAVRSVKSNAILLASGGAAVGVGMGQVNRVDSARLAVARAGDRARGAVAASDAFFPFADGLEILLEARVSAVVQPGGSVRDDEVIAAAARADVPLYFTGARHFFH